MSDRQPAASAHLDLDTLRRLVVLLQDDDVDAAIQAGLMAAWPDADADALDPVSRTCLLEVRQRLRTAWAARTRYERREARLARRASERDAARAGSVPSAQSTATGSPRPGLPASAAAILARAKARAGGAS